MEPNYLDFIGNPKKNPNCIPWVTYLQKPNFVIFAFKNMFDCDKASILKEKFAMVISCIFIILI